MKINLLDQIRFNLHLLLIFTFLGTFGVVNSQTSTWDGASWSNGAPSVSTGSYTFNVEGPDCIIEDANMATLNVNPNGDCIIIGVVTSNDVNIPLDYVSELIVDGTLNVTNLTNVSYLTGSGTINLSAGTYAQTDGTNFGICDVSNFNVISGSVTFPTDFTFQNMTIAQGATVTIAYDNPSPPSITTLTINGTLFNNYAYSRKYLSINNLTINPTGSFNGSSGYSTISETFKIGGTISPAGSVNSYNCNFNSASSTNVLEISGSANVKFSDLTYSDPSYQYMGALKVSGGGKFTIDKDLTSNSVAINAAGTVITSGTPTLTVTTSIDPIAGSLLLPGSTLNYTPGTLTLNGTNSALAYLNKPNYRVALSGTNDTIRNCNIQRVTVNTGAKGYVSNSASGYKIQRIDASDQVTITSLPKNDTIQVAATGSAVLTGSTRVGYMVDIATGGSLTSNGNLTMLDQSNLYFTTDGQIIGNIKWHRKYGSNGWIYMGVPFPNLTRGLFSTTGGISQQTIYMNKYVESRVSPRWVGVGSSEILGVGTGYILSMGNIITNDTLVFTGHPQLQTIIVSGLTYTYSNGAYFEYQRGYNLVANPYTAPISASGFFADNPTLNNIYYWDNLGQSNGVYVTRTSSGLFTPDIPSLTVKNQSKISASYLAPNQGFFIKLDETNYMTTTSVTFNPSSVTRDLNNNFLKSAPVYLRLYTRNASGTQNDIIFQFNDAATDNLNPAYDYSKLTSDTYPLEIYSLKKSNKLAIQTLKIDTSVHVPIGLIVKKNEKHSLWVGNFDALPAGTDISIYDKVANRSVNLRDSAFTVTLTAGTYDNRFEVVFKNNLFIEKSQPLLPSSSKSNGAESNVTVRTQYGQVFIDFNQEQKNVTIQVSDITGRVLYEKSLAITQGSLRLDSEFYLNKVYFIRIAGDGFLKTSKLLVQ